MKIIAQAQKPKDTNLRIIPFRKDASLSTHLLRLAGVLGQSQAWLQQDFSADYGQRVSLLTGDEKVVLLGLGEGNERLKWVHAFRDLSKSFRGLPLQAVSIDVRSGTIGDDLLPSLLEAATEGLYLGGYDPGRFKSSDPGEHPLWKTGATCYLLADIPMLDLVREAGERGGNTGSTLAGIMDLVNAPSNHKRPENLVAWAESSGKLYGYEVMVLDRDQLEEQGFHALLAVNRGSEDPATLIVATYKGGTNKTPVALVGKGVTFDTGGVSIKPSNQMHQMKSDMGGAAAVLGTIELAARLQLPLDLVVAVPVTDNSVGTRAIKPSDVISSYAGKTIEIIDTDAEGRLILADAINYLVSQYQPRILIDLATLTGSAMSTFGTKGAALFANNDQLAADLYRASDQSGERIWRLPLWEEYEEDLHSDVADIRNFSGRPLAGAIGAAKFLEFFTENHPAWAHLDIAGVAFSETTMTKMKSATGFGVRLLIASLRKLSDQG